jgi:hypothetical protein
MLSILSRLVARGPITRLRGRGTPAEAAQSPTRSQSRRPRAATCSLIYLSLLLIFLYSSCARRHQHRVLSSPHVHPRELRAGPVRGIDPAAFIVTSYYTVPWRALITVGDFFSSPDPHQVRWNL